MRDPPSRAAAYLLIAGCLVAELGLGRCGNTITVATARRSVSVILL